MNETEICQTFHLAIFRRDGGFSRAPPHHSSSNAVIDVGVYFARTGTYDVEVYTSPTLDVVPTRALELAVSPDDQPSQVVNVFTPATFKSEDFLGRAFGDNTRNLARVLHFKQTVSTVGKHTFKIHMVDPTVVVMKVVIHDAPLPASYFGPPELIRSKL